jgi:adenylate kinase
MPDRDGDEMVRIAISGVPGTGKTDSAKLLAEITGIKLIELKKIAKGRMDRTRKSVIVDVAKLRNKLKKERNVILEGLVAHLLNADYLFILRCRPDVLEKRLKRRGWSKAKIKENIQAEILDSITQETLKRKNIFEIDTTNLSKRQTTEKMIEILENRGKSDKIDWTRSFLKYLVE